MRRLTEKFTDVNKYFLFLLKFEISYTIILWFNIDSGKKKV